jgi:Zn-dependent protease
MLFDILSGGDIRDIIISLVFSMPIILLALSLHETAHGYVAYKCGDNTAYNLGRLTLNPFKHLDPMGFACMLLLGFGWAKPVPINTRNFRNPKRGMALCALAGPLSNAVLGLLSAAMLGFAKALYYYLALSGASSAFVLTCISYTSLLFELSALYNLLFMAFNLIPIPPFDGSRIMLVFLPPKAYFGIMKYERQIMIGLLVALMLLSRLGFSPFSWIAYNLTNLVANPVFKLFGKLFGIFY